MFLTSFMHKSLISERTIIVVAKAHRLLFLALIFLLFLLSNSNSFSQSINTIAGIGTAGYNSDGIAATTAKLYNPTGVALDAAGYIYIADVLIIASEK